jgi:hypothetical protein
MVNFFIIILKYCRNFDGSINTEINQQFLEIFNIVKV